MFDIISNYSFNCTQIEQIIDKVHTYIPVVGPIGGCFVSKTIVILKCYNVRRQSNKLYIIFTTLKLYLYNGLKTQ